MKCPSCQFENRPDVRFCENCGTALPVAEKITGNAKGIYCHNCGTPNAYGAKFCMSCGTAIGLAAPKSIPTGGGLKRTIFSFVRMLVVGFILTYLGLNIAGILQTLSPITGTRTAEAETLALNFVTEHYPQLANAQRTTYLADVQGTSYYVVDFVDRDRPLGVRILVDRLLRAVFAYEYIDGGK